MIDNSIATVILQLGLRLNADADVETNVRACPGVQ